MDVDKMTVDECRDWLADKDGWVKVKGTYGEGTWRHRSTLYDPCSNWSHPIPATLDAAAAAMPEGWMVKLEITSNGQCWAEASRKRNYLPVDDSDPYATGTTELEARFRLAVKARTANGGGGGQ